jgi:hypothetical protein
MHGVFSDIGGRSLKKTVVSSSGHDHLQQDVICGVGKQSRNGGPDPWLLKGCMIMLITAMAT